MTCLARTRKGKLCANAPQSGESLCGPHLRQLWPTEWAHTCGVVVDAPTETALRREIAAHACPRTSSGRELTSEIIADLVKEAEEGYDLSRLRRRE